jgi:hypothetical protein
MARLTDFHRQHSRRLVVDYFASAAGPGVSAHRAARCVDRCAARRRLLRLAQARRRLLCLRRASGCLGTSRGSLRGSLRHLSSTTTPCAGSSSTTSPPPRVWVPRHVARLVTRLVAPLVVDYSTSRRLVVDYFVSAVCLGASARRAARRAARRRHLRLVQARRRHLRLGQARRRQLRLAQAHRRLLRIRRASWCLGTSRSSSLVVDYFAYAMRPGASARRTARRVAHCATRR